jgi:hypothetical protein
MSSQSHLNQEEAMASPSKRVRRVFSTLNPTPVESILILRLLNRLYQLNPPVDLHRYQMVINLLKSLGNDNVNPLSRLTAMKISKTTLLQLSTQRNSKEVEPPQHKIVPQTMKS